jgi:ankyrin repeat protein
MVRIRMINEQEMDVFQAAYKGDLDFVQNYVASGSDINGLDKSDWTLLQNAIGNEELTKLLLSSGADPNIGASNRPLHLAASGGFFASVKHLLEFGAEVNAVDDFPYTPLNWGANSGSLEVCEALIKNGADIDANGLALETPVMTAADKGHSNLVKAFIGWGANINATSREGHTLLHFCAKAELASLIELLVDLGANVNAQNEDGETPLHWAYEVDDHDTTSGRFHRTYEALIKVGANEEMRNSVGVLPIVYWDTDFDTDCG